MDLPGIEPGSHPCKGRILAIGQQARNLISVYTYPLFWFLNLLILFLFKYKMCGIISDHCFKQI